MFPYVVPDYEFSGYVYKNVNGQWRSQTLEETFVESDISNIWNAYVGNYIVITNLYTTWNILLTFPFLF